MSSRPRSIDQTRRSGPRHRPWTVSRQQRWIHDLRERLAEANDDGERAYLKAVIEREMAHLDYMKEMAYA